MRFIEGLVERKHRSMDGDAVFCVVSSAARLISPLRTVKIPTLATTSFFGVAGLRVAPTSYLNACGDGR